jgi:hypothetical protein
MSSSVARGLPKPRRWSDSFKVGIVLTGNRKVARRLIALSGLSASTLTSLRPARTRWELPRQEFRAYCPRCCLEDFHRGETPYGRLVWQQAWYTVCRDHRIPLLLRRTTSGASWTRHQLQQDASLAAALGYQHAKHPQRERFYIQYALLELQEAIENALAGGRVAATYGMKPRQLLHALAVKPFIGPTHSFPDLPIDAALEPSELRYLARLARCDPSRLGVSAASKKPWILACDDWTIICPKCISATLPTGKPAYERTVWRVVTGSFCLRHRIPLVQTGSLPQDIDSYTGIHPTLNDLEQIIVSELMEFEASIARAVDGVAPRQVTETLNAA